MRSNLRPEIWLRVLLPLIIVLALGVSLRPAEVERGLRAAGELMREDDPQPSEALEASRLLERAAERLTWRVDLWEPAGILALKGEDPSDALRLLERADRAGALTPAGQLALGSAYRQTGDLQAAIHTWEDIRQSENPPEAVFELLLEAYQATGDQAAAISTLQALAGLHPADANLRYRLGLLTATFEPQAALAHLAQASEMDESLRQPAQALMAAIRTASLNDDPAHTLVGSGRGLASIGQWALAEQAFSQAVRLQPGYAEAWAFWGEARQHLNPDDPQAGAALEKALQLDDSSLTAYMLLALHYQRLDRSDRALETLQSAVKLFPANPALQVELGNTLAMQGDLEAGLLAHQRAVELAPRDPAYLRLLAEYSIRHEHRPHQVALPAARRAIALDPQAPASVDVMGQVLLLLNDLAGAERFFLRALQLDEGYAPARLHLGLVFIVSDQPARAYAEWKQVSSLAPGSQADQQAQRLLNNYFP